MNCVTAATHGHHHSQRHAPRPKKNPADIALEKDKITAVQPKIARERPL
jgi:calcineurin-like phosphoesterase family protein